MILTITSLRKGGEALEQAVQAWRNGKKIALPTECGYFIVGEGDIWLSAEAPDRPELQALFHTFWPGPLRLLLPHDGGKRSHQVPAHPLAQAFLRLTGEPVAAREGPPEQAEIVLEWKDPPQSLVASIVDCACTPWRWLRSGLVERQELEWVSGQATILSGDALPRLEHGPAPIFREKQSYRIEP